MTVSHTEPFSPTLQVALAGGGWLIFVSQMITAAAAAPASWRRWVLPGRRRPRRGRGTLRGRRDLAAAGVLFALLVGAAAAVGATGNLSSDCASAATCFKVDNYRAADGSYYRQYPYDAAGNDDRSAAWVPIGRAEYVAEVGSLLRGAAFSGIVALALGMIANLGAERLASDSAVDEEF